MSILGDLQKFNQDALIEVYVLDASNKGAALLYFHAGTNELKDNIVWQGQEYTALPVKMEGFEVSGEKFARPKLQVANTQGAFSALVRAYGDLIGAKVIRKRTTVRYLDAVNFALGNPDANPAEHLPDDVFYIRRKTLENRVAIEFELGSSLDLAGVQIPRHKVIAKVCRFKYRQDGCGYAGGPVANALDIPTTDINLDRCSNLVSGCKLRFGENGELPFGGYVGADLLEF